MMINIYVYDDFVVSILRAIGVDEQIDEVVIDFSPLRTTESSINRLAHICSDESSKYNSLVGIEDHTATAIAQWGSDVLELMFNNDAIWRIPAIVMVFSFSVRAEGKQVIIMIVMMIVMMIVIMIVVMIVVKIVLMMTVVLVMMVLVMIVTVRWYVI